ERDARALADVSLGVPSAEAALYLMNHLQRIGEHGDMLNRSVHNIARYGDEPLMKELLELARRHEPRNLGEQAALFREIEQGLQERQKPLPEAARAWATELTGQLLASKHGPDVESGIKLAGELQMKDHASLLAELAGRRGTPEGQRKAALEALVKIDTRKNTAV